MQIVVEAAIAIALLAVIAAIAVVVIVSGPDALAPTGFHDLAILLGGALAGVTTGRITGK